VAGIRPYSEANHADLKSGELFPDFMSATMATAPTLISMGMKSSPTDVCVTN